MYGIKGPHVRNILYGSELFCRPYKEIIKLLYAARDEVKLYMEEDEVSGERYVEKPRGRKRRLYVRSTSYRQVGRRSYKD